jgi:4-oxalocrotonate tautomerase family enzyme
MPLITIKVLKGALSGAQKNEMICRVTDVVAEIESSPETIKSFRPHIWCLIEEMDFGNWGVGGGVVTPEMLDAIKGGNDL